MPPATDKLDAGFRADFLFGQNAAVTKSLGLNLGDNADLIQGYAVLNLPLAGEGKYVQFRVGKMATLMGFEVIEDVVNPNLSVANQFVYLENFTNTGLRVDVKPSAAIDFQLAVFNGWDVVEDNNTRKSFMGRVGIAATADHHGRAPGLLRPRADATPRPIAMGPRSVLPETRRRTRGAVSSRATMARTKTWLALARTPSGGVWACGAPTMSRRWWGLGFGATTSTTGTGRAPPACWAFPPTPATSSAASRGRSTSGCFPAPWSAPEFRYDRSNLEVYGEDDPSKNQVSFGLGASYIF